MSVDLMDQVTPVFATSRKDLSTTYLFACQHILRPREAMLNKIVGFGIPRQNIHIIGKIYSTNDRLLAELDTEGYSVHQPPRDQTISFDEQHRRNCEYLLRTCLNQVPDGSRVIVLDDGAMLLKVFNDNYDTFAARVTVLGIEQTSSGFRILEQEKLHFPVINVARSDIKLRKETPHVAEVCLEAARQYFDQKKHKPERYLVIGLGRVGQEIYTQLQREGREVYGYDIALHSETALEKIKHCLPDVIVGATGQTSLSEDDIRSLASSDYPLYLMSVSSSDREFSAMSFRKGDEVGLHDDVVYGSVTFVNNGYPINFNNQNQPTSSDWIVRTICLLMGSVMYLASLPNTSDLYNGFHDVPEGVADVL
jgi:hypothetical protein